MTTSGFLYPFPKIRATVLMLTVFFVCAGISPVLAQGWELAVGGNGEELGEAIVVTSDWGLLAVGDAQPVDNNSNQSVNLYAVKTDVDGTILWKRDYNLALYERSKAIQVLPNQQYLIAAEASFVSQGGPYELLLAKIDEQGTLLDTAFFSLDEVPNLRINDMVADGDSGYLVVGYADYGAADDDDMVIIKITPELTLEWYQILNIGLNDRANAIALVEDGFVITGQIDSQVPPPAAFGDDVVTLKVNNSGEVVWQQRIATNRDDAGKDILVNDQGEVVLTGFADKDLFIWKYDENGVPLDSLKHNVYGNSNGGEGIIKTESGYVVCGFTEGSDSEVKWLIVEVEEDLSITWSSDNGVPLALNYSYDVSKALPAGYAMAGFTSPITSFIFDLNLVKTDQQGLIISNGIEGQVIHDIDESCDIDPGEPSLSGWLVRATNSEGASFFSITDEEGRYSMTVDSGSYVVDVLIRNDYWESCFPNGVNISFDQLYDTIAVDLPVKAVYIDCPLMEVEVSTPYLSNCFDIEYTVNYANGGTGGTNGEAMVEVELDPSLTFLGASLPFTVDDGIYTFDIGEVPYNTEGSFKINTSMDCEGIIEDQSALVTAVIFPDTLCTPVDPDWNGASISVDGVCSDQDEIVFTVDNTSTVPMLSSKTFFIVETDAVVFISQDYNLGPGESASAPLIDPDGKTYRIIAEQVDGHPGSNFPTKAVEGCGTDDEGNYSVGYVTQWPENDADPSVSIHVDEVLGEVPDAAMMAHPKGWQDSLITSETELTYRVFFRNVTTDSVMRVVVRDTLPATLDVTTIRFGASSHPVTYDIYDEGIIKATFENLELPIDGDEPLDYAFFEYTIAQKADNPLGTVIENSALVIYDYNTPIYTGTVKHVVGPPTYKDLLVEVIPVDVDEPEWASSVEVNVFPNPATEYVTLEVDGLEGSHELTFTLMNLYGQPLRSINEAGNQATFSRNDLPAGSYIYLVRADGQKIAAGTLIIR